MDTSKTWSQAKFSMTFGGLGLGLTMWAALVIMNAYVVPCFPNFLIAISALFLLFVLGTALTWFKANDSSMQKLIDRAKSETPNEGFKYALPQAGIAMFFMLILSHVLRFAVYHLGLVNHATLFVASISFFGVFFIWQLFAMHVIKSFHGICHKPSALKWA